MLLQSAENMQASDHGVATVDKVFIPWQLTVILMKYMVEKLYHTYKECQQTVISITNYKYENHVYWQTVIFTLV